MNGKCLICGQMKAIVARCLCHNCYKKAWSSGTIELFDTLDFDDCPELCLYLNGLEDRFLWQTEQALPTFDQIPPKKP
jgi:hypothetical protein